jgi:hypothetical protein
LPSFPLYYNRKRETKDVLTEQKNAEERVLLTMLNEAMQSVYKKEKDSSQDYEGGSLLRRMTVIGIEEAGDGLCRLPRLKMSGKLGCQNFSHTVHMFGHCRPSSIHLLCKTQSFSSEYHVPVRCLRPQLASFIKGDL